MRQSSGFHNKHPGMSLLYEDRDLVVVDKPVGLLSISREGSRDKSVYSLLSEYLLHKKGESPAVVHRLDRETSGVMVFAKSGWVKKKLMEHWDESVTLRQYVCVAEGDFPAHAAKNAPASKGSETGLIDLPLGEDKSGRIIVKKDGKPARTKWKLLNLRNGYSLLELELETGRRNQIRAHLAALGCPVAGDKKYWAKTDPLKRLCLHATVISIYHPRDNRLLEFRSPVPNGFERIFQI